MRRGQTQSTLVALIIAVVAVSTFTLFGIYFLRGGNEAYQFSLNETQYQAFDQSTQIVNLTRQTEQQFIGYNQTGTNVGDIINVVTTGGYNTLKIIGGIPAILNNLMAAAAYTLGVPQAITTLAFVVVIAIIISVFILLVFRVRS